MARTNAVKMDHFYSNEWCKDQYARSQEELQEIAKKIRENCEVETIEKTSYGCCTVYRNRNLGLKYWIKDDFGHISEIDEAREY